MNDKLHPPCSPLESRCDKNTVCCVDTYRIYDSCIGQECLRGLRFFATDVTQPTLNTATALRIRDISVIWTQILSEEVPFRSGYYNITARYYFSVTLDACQGLGAAQTITGLACYDKNVILYGGEGNVSTFYSDTQQSFCATSSDYTAINLRPSTPRVVVEVAPPVGLEVILSDQIPEDTPLCFQNLPQEIAEQFEGSFTGEFTVTKTAFVTLGIFTIIRVERPAQLTMQSALNCFPDKTCEGSDVFTDACTLFSSMEFPYEEFAPTPRMDLPDLSVDRSTQDPTLSPNDYT